MTAFTFDIAAFKVEYEDFASFSDAKLQRSFNSATYIVLNSDSGCLALNGDARYHALTLLTAHLLQIGVNLAAGEATGQVASASIDKVSVTLVPLPGKTNFQAWLNGTTYGQELLILLQVSLVGGIYVGGGPERSAFPNAGY